MAAAGDRADQISADPAKQLSSRRLVGQARQTIVHFLEVVPDDLTVFELKGMLDMN